MAALFDGSILGRMARGSVRLLLVGAAVIVLAIVVVKLRLVVLPALLSLFIVVILAPPKDWLISRRVPPALASLLVLVAALAALVVIVTLLAPRFATELAQLGATAAAGIEEVTSALAEGSLGISAVDVDRALNDALITLESNSAQITQGLLSGALLIGEVLAGLLLMLVMIFFYLKDGDRIWAWIVDFFPSGQTRVDVNELGRRAWATLTGYIRGVTLVAIVDSVLIGIALAILGVPLVLPLAVLTFFAAFFPLIGAFTAGLLAALVALVSQGVLVAVIVVIVITLIQQLEGDILYPVVVGRAIRLHPLAILVALTAGGVTAGVMGALLAPPLMAVGWSVAAYLRDHADRPPIVDAGGLPLAEGPVE